MKAIVYREYGSPDVLKLEEVRKPVPGDDEVLVKVQAASINSWDWDLLRGKPRLFRLLFGLLRPKYWILGCDIAGHVEAVGINVKKFHKGDEVFGDISGGGWGGFAEYVCARADALTLIPDGMTFEESAAVPQAGVLALQGLRDKKQIQPGQKVLINGAGGGVGTFAVQIAKLFGAEVTGVDSREKLDMLRSIGADHVLDYRQEDFTDTGQQYDLILDVVAHRSMFDYMRALRPGGIYVMIGGSVARIFQLIFLRPLIAGTTGKKMEILVHHANKDLDFLKELLVAGKIAPVIDRRYPLSEVPEAFQYFGEGLVKGKIIITI
jgi:NADPH:quinone reductase-like Zn-dependent oxidoreductase